LAALESGQFAQQQHALLPQRHPRTGPGLRVGQQRVHQLDALLQPRPEQQRRAAADLLVGAGRQQRLQGGGFLHQRRQRIGRFGESGLRRRRQRRRSPRQARQQQRRQRQRRRQQQRPEPRAPAAPRRQFMRQPRPGAGRGAFLRQ